MLGSQCSVLKSLKLVERAAARMKWHHVCTMAVACLGQHTRWLSHIFFFASGISGQILAYACVHCDFFHSTAC